MIINICLKSNYMKMITFKHRNEKKVNFPLEEPIKAPKRSTGIALSFFTSALDGSEWLTSRPGQFISGNDPVLIVQETGWAPGPSGRVWKISSTPGFDPRTIHSVASRYTAYPISVRKHKFILKNNSNTLECHKK